MQQAALAQLEGFDTELLHFAWSSAGSSSHGKQVTLKFCSVVVANRDDSDDVLLPKMWEDKGVQGDAHHLWARCRESGPVPQCPPCVEGQRGQAG